MIIRAPVRYNTLANHRTRLILFSTKYYLGVRQSTEYEREMPRKAKKRKSGSDFVGTIQKVLDEAAKAAPKLARIYSSYRDIRTAVEKTTAHQGHSSVGPLKVRQVRPGFGIVEDENQKPAHKKDWRETF